MFVNRLPNNTQNYKNNNQGCQAAGKDGKCGETKTLEILKEFQDLYENKINQVKDECSCTSTRIKIQMLQDWVRDLTEQNSMLVQVVEELEQEASERVFLLEEKLRHSSKTSFEIMKTLQNYDTTQNLPNQSDIFQRLLYYQSDVNNLTEFIRRIRDEGVWNSEGLHFYSVAQEDLCGDVIPSSAKNLTKQNEMESSLEKLKLELSKSKHKQDSYEKDTKNKEKLIELQSEQIKKLNEVVDRYASSVPDKQKLLEELQELQTQLKLKNDDFSRLELSVKDMREALTTEVADKHDSVVALRRECQLLEERCRQADKQTHFKDDIIKEMRKELKQFRSKYELDEKKESGDLRKQIVDLQEENKTLHKTISNANNELNVLHDLIQKYCMYEECEDKIILGVNDYKANDNKSTKKSEQNIDTLVKYEQTEEIEISFRNSLESFCEELMLKIDEIKQDDDKINKTKSQMNLPSDKMLVLHEANSNASSSENDKFSDISEYEFNKTLFLLKEDISKIILYKSSHELQTRSSEAEIFENTIQEIESKNQVIKNKDELISIQVDSLNVAQNELKELRAKLLEVEKDRNSKVHEVQNLHEALKLNQNTIEELEKALRNSEEKANNIQNTADLYVETISLLDSAKSKAETEVEQQRITIGNLQDALVSTKQQLEGVQNRTTAELKEKSDVIYSLYQELDEMQTQYVDCYEETVKLCQTADCLRDANLDLKVANVNLQQDIEELNMKLTNDKMVINTLEENIKKVLSTNEILEGDVTFMKNEMGNLSTELKVLQELLKRANVHPLDVNNSSLSTSLHILQEHSESLIEQLKMAQIQVTREVQLNNINTTKIEQLQKLLNEKSTEMEELRTSFNDSNQQCQFYENKIKSMEIQNEKCKQQLQLNEEKTDKMFSTCNADLDCLKQKIELLNTILTDKSDEILRLHAELSLKSDKLAHLTKDQEIVIKDNKKLTQNALNLEEQLNYYKSRCSDLGEKYKKSKTDIEHIKHWEDALHEEFKQEKKTLMSQLDYAQEEEKKMNVKLQELKDELEEYKWKLKQKDEDSKQLALAQEEIISLKEEINRFTKQRSRLLTENKKIQEQLSHQSINLTHLESRKGVVSQQLDKCLQDINALQSIKEKLEERNIQLETEIEHLQRAFTELNQEFRYKHESVINLEQELSETKNSRDEICAESRIVVNNVRAWLEEQKRINAALNNTIREKNSLIEELTVERNLLLKNIKDVCERYEALSEELHVCRQYLIQLNEDQTKPTKSLYRLKRSTYTMGSQGSAGETPNSSPVFFEDQELSLDNSLDRIDDDTDDNPSKWMQKVQNMSEDLMKSKKYWQMKMSPSKNIKPVKENKKKSNSA